jgi:uncharacterized protein YgiM (DUF1202 family)
MNSQRDPIAFIPVRARFSVTAFMGYGWYSVSYQGIRGYVQRGEYLRYEWTLHRGNMPFSSQSQGVVICSSMSIRDDRSLRATLLATARNGETLSILSEMGDWYQVRHVDRNGKETIGWARAIYIVKNPITVTALKSLQAYSYPSVAAKCVGELPTGTELIVIAQYNEFYCVNLRSASAFVLVKDCAINGGDVGAFKLPGTLARE